MHVSLKLLPVLAALLVPAVPALARSSIRVPPAKSMPKFMPTSTNISTDTMESTAEKG